MSAFKIVMDVWFVLALALCADSDRRIHEIPNLFLWGIALPGLVQFGHALGAKASVWPYLCAAPLFIVLLIFWRWGQIGGGDVKLMTLMCFYMGILQAVAGFALSAIILAGWCVYRALKKKGNAHTPVALTPSLAVGCIGAMAAQYMLAPI